MTSSRSNIDRPAPRWAISIVLAIAIHAVIIAVAWPFISPLMVRAFGPAQAWRPQVDTGGGDEMPIIVGSISNLPPPVEEPVYASPLWDQATFVPADRARLPFTSQTPAQFGTREAIAPPPRRPIAPPAR
jgi:hypothetical protein